MTKQEFSKIATVLRTMYPEVIPSKEAFDIWYSFFEADEYMAVNEAVKRHIANSPYPPTVADLRKSLTAPGLNEEEAWDRVVKAIRNSNWHSEEEFEKLPPLLQKCVGSPRQLRQWGSMDSNDIHTVEKSHFLRTYRAEAERERQTAQTPITMRIEADEARKLLEGV